MKILASILCCGLIAMAAPVSWDQAVVPPSSPPVQPAESKATMIQEDAAAGLELWSTLLGQLWIPRPGVYVIKLLEWEQALQKVYDHPRVRVRQGDVVIDCGAHIGVFTRAALRAGARLVVAVEPEEANLVAFRRNLAAELKAGKVKLVTKGVWDKSGRVGLHLSPNSGSHSVVLPQNQQRDESIEVTTLDLLVRSLKLPRVDFVKMDIEGAEKNALRGARGVIQRYRPRLAISSYHLKGDPAAIAALAWQFRPDYLIQSKDLVEGLDGTIVPKVLFFH